MRDPRGRLRDPPPASDGRGAQASAPGGRATDARLGSRRRPGGRGRGRGPPRHEQPLRIRLRAVGRAERRGGSRRRYAIETAGLESDELVVLAGDNLFDFSLPGFVEWWRSKPSPASAVPLHDVGDLELAKQYGIADTDADDRIVRFVEKPSDPRSTL